MGFTFTYAHGSIESTMYTHIFLGGTFDKLHAGHKKALQTAFDEGRRVTIGLTSDAFVLKYKEYPGGIRSFEERKSDLLKYLAEQNWSDKAEIISIDDPHEPAASGDYDALIVTRDNRVRGDEINVKRTARNLTPLALIDVPIVPAEDGSPISSTRVRNGEIDGNGKLRMPEDMRSFLGKPMGKVLKTDEEVVKSFAVHKDGMIITVGDKSTKRALDLGFRPVLAILDHRVAREPYEELKSYDFSGYRVEHVKSGPGYISKKAHALIEAWAGDPKPLALIVEGEEDLLTLPAVAFAPEGSVIYYGQPGEGLVEVMTAEGYQKKAHDILDRFELDHPDISEGGVHG